MSELTDPPRPEVKPLVTEDIYWAMKKFGKPRREYTEQDISNDETLGLGSDLGIPAKIRKALSVPYTKTSKGIYGGRVVTQGDALKAATIKTSIDLVHKRSNGQK